MEKNKKIYKNVKYAWGAWMDAAGRRLRKIRAEVCGSGAKKHGEPKLPMHPL